MRKKKTSDLFQTVDLFEAKNINQVIQCIHSLGRQSRLVAGFNGPYLGPKVADKNERSFTEEQLRASESVVPLQNAGSPGANQSGMVDTSRNIVKVCTCLF
jgi:topoisomerase IA-like protein